jgi:uncharacterized RDD family membrane protein YckC
MAPSDPAVPPPPPPVWASGPSGAPQVRYGGFWLRVVAYIIDAIVLNIVLWLLTVITGLRLISYTATDHLEPLPILAPLVVNWLYFALMESSQRGATIGKMALGLRVVTDQGQRLSFARATGRYFAKFISALILGIGFLMVAFTERKRGLHDMIASTLVVKVP